MSTATPRRFNAGTIIPLAAFLLIALVILGAYLAQRSTAEQGDGATPQQEAAAALTQYERRDSQDPLTAGPVDAPVGLVVFSDYQCPYCAQWNAQTLPTLMRHAEQGELRIEWRDLNIFGEASATASRAAYAAALQDNYWEYHDALYPDGKIRPESELTEEALISLAASLGLDTERFAADLVAPATLTAIDRNQQLGLDLGAASTPVFLLGGVPISGAQPTEVFLQTFERALAQAGH